MIFWNCSLKIVVIIASASALPATDIF